MIYEIERPASRTCGRVASPFRSIASLILLFLLGTAFAEAQLANTLAFDAKTRRWCWIEKTTNAERDKILAGTQLCPNANIWTPSTDFFHAGSVVEFYVVRQRFLSSFEAKVNAVVIQEVRPAIRGYDEVPPAGAVTSESKGENIASSSDSSKAPEWRDKLIADYNAAKKARADAQSASAILIGDVPGGQVPSPGVRLNRVRRFTSDLAASAGAAATAGCPAPVADAGVALNAFGPLPACRDLPRFVGLLDSADSVIAAVVQVNQLWTSSSSQKKSLDAALGSEQTFLTDAQTASQNLQNSRTAPAADIRDYLPPSGSRYVEIANELTQINYPALMNDINSSLVSVFENINAYFARSETSDPYSVYHGQWSTNARVDVSVQETPGFQPYGFTSQVTVGSSDKAPGNGQPPAGGNAGVNQGALNAQLGAIGVNPSNADTVKPKDKPGTEDVKPSDPKPGDLKPNIPPFRIDITIHKYYRANLTAGFMVSSLRNREYGIGQVRSTDDSGKPVSGDDKLPKFDAVAVIGEARRPQTHYYTGLNYYFHERDAFPNAKVNYLTPGLLLGYGTDDAFNFMVGPNWETKWGVNFGLGWHVGRETFLKPGINPFTTGAAAGSYTILAAGTADPPTISRTRVHGLYINVGFDAKIFKTIFGGGSTPQVAAPKPPEAKSDDSTGADPATGSKDKAKAKTTKSQ